MSSALLQALLDSQYGAAQEGTGIAAQSLGTVAPALYNPYASTGQNVGLTLGAGLLAGVLGGLAKRSANEKNAELYSAMTSLGSMTAPDREAAIAANPRLATYGLALRATEDEAARALAQKRQELELGVEYDLKKEAGMVPYRRGQKLEDALLGAGKVYNPDTNEIIPIDALDPVKQKVAEAEAMIPLKVRETGAIEEARAKAEADALGYNPKRASSEMDLRKEFNALPEVKSYRQVEKAAGIINQAIADPSAVSDLELTRYSILLIEPGMAVREGEQAAVANSQSIPDSWKGEARAALDGSSRLSPTVREGLKNLAKRAFEGNKKQYDDALSFYQSRARDFGLNPEAISFSGQSPSYEQIVGGAVGGSGLGALSDSDLETLIAQKQGG